MSELDFKLFPNGTTGPHFFMRSDEHKVIFGFNDGDSEISTFAVERVVVSRALPSLVEFLLEGQVNG